MKLSPILTLALCALLSAGAAAAQPSLASSNPQPGEVNLPNLMAKRLAEQKAAVDAYAQEPTAENLAAARAKAAEATDSRQNMRYQLVFCSFVSGLAAETLGE